ncbi:alpha/beta-hydrolase [Pholiota conissans]|uniref:Alpha/beta-hydrolase n=1 Tax=Pholiota conissans TaxID=109636 RepID=A0A9P5YPV3_9AGAR|nr:alpha/beta-hydrolase [Pholiota conissans]
MHPTAFTYKTLQSGAPIALDFHPPNTKADSTTGQRQVAAVIYFHGGGLHVGNKSAVPRWLYRRVTGSGWALISVNYQLLPPASGHDIIKDIQDLFVFLEKETLSADGQVFKVDVNRLVVSGSSSGGHCAYLAAMHASPKPKGVFAAYSPAGNFLIPQYLEEKTKPFFMGRDLLDASKFQDYIYPFPNGPLEPTSDIPLVFGAPPTNRRVAMAALYLQLGTYLDYVTGQHEPSLSGSLRKLLADETKTLADLEMAIPEKHRALFPQLAVDSSWPPTLLMTGTADTAVLPEESYHFHDLLEKAKVRTVLVKVPGVDHLFDFAPDAKDKWAVEFDLITNFMAECLRA